VKRAIPSGVLLLAAGLLTGCVGGPRILPIDKRATIDRAVVERPSDLQLTTFINDLDAPTAIDFDPQGNVILLLGGVGNLPVRIVALSTTSDRRLDIYPAKRGLLDGVFSSELKVRGPVGGLAIKDGEIYLSHRDENGRGVISAFDYDGNRRTVVADLPAQGDHSVTDLAFHPINGRLYFGLGSMTNSGVVGLDNWQKGWVNKNRQLADLPAVDLRLLGSRFDTRNPKGGLFGGDDIAVTAPYQPFASSTSLRINRAPTNKPTAALYSISPRGGDLRVEAHGIRHARGLTFNEFGNLFVTNQGMEMRGTRPVKDDPDVVLRVPLGGAIWYGWPDFSADLLPVSETRFQPPRELLLRTGYPEVGFVIDHTASGLIRPDRDTLLRGTFASLSGAAKMDFVPSGSSSTGGAFDLYGSDLIVALSGDRAPFATTGYPLKSPVGYKVVRLDPSTKQVTDFVVNTQGVPQRDLPRRTVALERPVDVKFGPDGAMYIVDMGRVNIRNGNLEPARKSGKVLRLSSTSAPATMRPATTRSAL
jgi:glucose/arabinose dehydrogenase